jgi:tetratricopeptide (TPR) repeat protein
MGIKLQLFGPFKVWRDEQEVTVEIHGIGKADSILKLLVSQPGQTFTLDQLIEAVWSSEIAEGKTDTKKTTSNLYRCISEMRRLLEPHKKASQSQYILKTSNGYCWNSRAECRIDVIEFVEHSERAQALQAEEQFAQAAAEYEAALKLVQGEYLADDRYADWAVPLRQKWQETYLNLLERLADCHARLGQYRHAITRSSQVLQLEELRESVYCQLMLYHYLSGNQPEALRMYEQCAKVLRAQLNIEPGTQTKELYEQIKARHIPGIDQIYKPQPMVRHEIPYTLSPGSVPFVGRKIELAQLLDYVEQASKGHGSCVLISGEAGVGKTCLIQELTASAAKRFKIQVLQSRCDELSQSYQNLAALVRDGLDKLRGEDLQMIPRLWLAEVARLIPELRRRMPELPENPLLPPQQEQLRFFEGIVQFFLGLIASESISKPIILFLDDLHWADESSVSFLNYFLPRVEEKPILILGTYRSEEVIDGHPFLKLVQGGEPKNLLHSVSLSRLEAAQVGEFIGKLPLKIKRPEIFAGRLYQETRGNPFFLIATLQHFFEEGALSVEDEYWVTHIEDISANYKELMIPPSVKELIVRRLSRLNETEEKLLRLASVIGREFELALLERAWDGNGECIAALMSLTSAKLLVDHQGHYEFGHDKIREVAYGEISPQRKQLLHQRVLRALEQQFADRQEERVGLLAQHAYRAGEWKKALEYAIQALKQTVKDYRQHEGLGLAELSLKALQQLEATGEDRLKVSDQLFKILAQREEILESLGRGAEQEQDQEQLQGIAEMLGDVDKLADVCKRRGLLFSKRGKYPEAEELVRKALVLFQETKNKPGEAKCLNNIGNIYFFLAKYEEALNYFQKALGIRQEIGDRQGEGKSLGSMGRTYLFMGRFEEALNCFQQYEEICRVLREPRDQAESLNGLGGIYFNMGEYKEALRFFQQSLEICKDIGDRSGQDSALNNIGLVYREVGQYEEALHHLQLSVKISREMNNQQGEVDSLNNIAVIYWLLGQYNDAIAYYKETVGIFQKLGDRNGLAGSLNDIGHIWWHVGRYKDALHCYQQALDIRREIGDLQGQAFSLNGLGWVHWSLGQYEQALSYHQRAAGISHRINGREQIYNLSGLGWVHWSLGQYEHALSNFAHTLELSKKMEDRRSQGESFNGIGWTYLGMKRYNEALDNFQKALMLRQQIRDRSGQSRSLIGLGNLYRDLKQFAEAKKHYEQARAISKELDEKPVEVLCLSESALALLQLNEKDMALEHSSQAIQIFKTINSCEKPELIYFIHFKVLNACGRKKEARSYLQKAQSEISQRSCRFKNPEFRESFLKNVKTNSEIVEEWEKQQQSQEQNH